jgi:glycosyltransferase involved in cell wall biosynthesis
MISKVKHERVCIVIPSFNEATAIGSVIDGVKKVFKKTNYSIEIVVIDDASSDDTATIAKKHGATVIRHILNSGAGGATSTGLRYAELNNFSICVTMDADGQHAPEDVLKGVSEINASEADLLIGSRLIDSQGMSRLKVLGNRGLSFITRILFGINSTDSQSGLRVFSRQALEKLRWTTSGYEFCSEMLWRANQLGLKIGEFPIQAIYTDYSKSKGQSNWNAVNIIKSLLKRRLVEFFE